MASGQIKYKEGDSMLENNGIANIYLTELINLQFTFLVFADGAKTHLPLWHTCLDRHKE